jgi:hypothetical protein
METAPSPEPSAALTLCIRCEYDLSGLPAEGACPECALPIERSIERSTLLRDADHPWLGRIHAGLWDLERAIVIPVVLLGTSLLLMLAALILSSVVLGTDSVTSWAVGVGGGLALLAAASLHIRGCIRLGAGTHPDYTPPAFARVSVAIGGGAVFPALGSLALLGAWTQASLVLLELNLLAIALAQAVGVAFCFGLASVLHTLEHHLPTWSPEIAKRQRNVRKNLYALAIVLAVSWIAILFGRIAAPNSSTLGGLFWIGIAYVALHIAIRRTRREVELEIAAAPSAAM